MNHIKPWKLKKVTAVFILINIQDNSKMSCLIWLCLKLMRYEALSIQPKSPEISVGSSNGTDHFGLVRPEYSGPALKVVHFDRSGHFGLSDRNAPFHLPKLLSPVPLFCNLLTRTSSEVL